MTDAMLKKLRPGELRYVVRSEVRGRTTYYYVYDKAMASRPGIRHGIVVQKPEGSTDVVAVQKMCDQLEELSSPAGAGDLKSQ